MPRQAQPTATSVQALQTAVPLPQGLPSTVIGEAGSSDALAKLNSAVAELRAYLRGAARSRS